MFNNMDNKIWVQTLIKYELNHYQLNQIFVGIYYFFYS